MPLVFIENVSEGELTFRQFLFGSLKSLWRRPPTVGKDLCACKGFSYGYLRNEAGLPDGVIGGLSYRKSSSEPGEQIPCILRPRVLFADVAARLLAEPGAKRRVHNQSGQPGAKVAVVFGFKQQAVLPVPHDEGDGLRARGHDGAAPGHVFE